MISEAYLMDCMEFMATIPDKWFDLAVVDPEYGIKASEMTMGSGKHKFKKGKKWDNKIPDKSYFTELFRISKNQIIWGDNYFSEYLKPTPHWLVWDKKNPNLSFAEGELAWVSNGKLLRIFKHYSAQVEVGGKIHPTEKPIKLYSWIYANYLPQGGKVFDSHAGSNNNRIAADMAGNIDYYSTEIDPDYFNDAEKRWREYKAQAVLTFPERIDPVQSELF